MSDRGILFLVSVAVVVMSLAAAVWLVVSGQAAYLDGIFLVTICLLMAAAFGLYIAFLIRRAIAELEAPKPAPKAAAAAGASKVKTAGSVPVEQQ